MKQMIIVLSLVLSAIACTSKIYPTNGETIYRTGKNSSGVTVLDKSRSSITIFNSCQSCHGPHGDRMKNSPIRYSDLGEVHLYNPPYNDSLIVRFLDHDLESNGKKADIGVRWKISDKDKTDLIAFLKILQ